MGAVITMSLETTITEDRNSRRCAIQALAASTTFCARIRPRAVSTVTPRASPKMRVTGDCSKIVTPWLLAQPASEQCWLHPCCIVLDDARVVGASSEHAAQLLRAQASIGRVHADPFGGLQDPGPVADMGLCGGGPHRGPASQLALDLLLLNECTNVVEDIDALV